MLLFLLVCPLIYMVLLCTNPFWQNIASLYTIEEPSKPVILDYWYNLLLVYDPMFAQRAVVLIRLLYTVILWHSRLVLLRCTQLQI